jgi:hypothetical protein
LTQAEREPGSRAYPNEKRRHDISPKRNTSQSERAMSRFAAIFSVVLVFLAGPDPAAAQSRANSCYPYCSFTHYYGPYDYRYASPGLYCYPICRADGSCYPNPSCTSQAPRGRITVRSLAGSVTTTPTTVEYYDPSVVAVPGQPRRRRSR